MLIAEYSYETDIKVQRREAFRLGKEEGAEQKAIETAKKFIKMGLPLEQIAEGTGLSKEVVQQLAEENKK
jgi:predicted transposase/invertase (TIGR01784 family)